MQLWEQRLVDLDAPANDYLRAYRLIPAEGRLPAGDGAPPADPHRRDLRGGATPPGVFMPDFGESVKVGQSLPTLAEYYRRRPAPGRRAGHEVHVHQPRVRHARPDRRGRERAAPRPLLPRAHLRAPRHGGHATCSDPERVRSRLATGYTLGARRRQGGHGARDGHRAERLPSTPRPQGHGSLRRGPARRRRQRARLGARTGDPGHHVRAALPAGSPHPGHRAGVLPGRPGWPSMPSSTRASCPGFNSQIFLAPDDGVGVIAFTNGARRRDAVAAGRSPAACSGTCSASPTKRSAPTFRSTRRCGPTSVVGTSSRARSPMCACRVHARAPGSRSSSAAAGSCSGA